jgi:HAD superfamily hydrolase (TIGR01509 family)
VSREIFITGNMPELLLSDIDGTLVDSNALHAEAWRRAFEQFGIHIGFDEAWRQIGKGGDNLIPVFAAPGDLERLKEPLKQLRKEIFHRDYMPRVVSFPKSREMLLRVKESGKKIALATSGDEEDLATYGRIVGMDDLIEKASSSADAKHSKPDPDIFAAALKKVGMRPEQAIGLGDTPYDAEAAGKLGIPVIGLTSGGWKEDDLRDAGCVEVYRSPADLLLHFSDSLLAH